jgi:hypothetical protein
VDGRNQIGKLACDKVLYNDTMQSNTARFILGALFCSEVEPEAITWRDWINSRHEELIMSAKAHILSLERKYLILELLCT